MGGDGEKVRLGEEEKATVFIPFTRFLSLSPLCASSGQTDSLDAVLCLGIPIKSQRVGAQTVFSPLLRPAGPALPQCIMRGNLALEQIGAYYLFPLLFSI